jgi:hypothetical protein
VSFTRLWLFLAVALPVLASIVATLSAVDLTYHLRAGSEILTTGAVPTVDTWTYTAAGRSWVDQQWGAQVVLRVAEAIGSWTGLVLLRAGLTGLIVGCLLVIARRRGLDARTTALLVLAAFVIAAPAMALRPQLLGMACFAVVLLLVADRRARPRGIWLVPVLVLVWANLHGSFFLGPLVLGLAWLEDVHDGVPRPHRTLLVAVIAAAAACLTPFGPAVWVYAVALSSNPEVTARITEWQPTSIREPSGILFFGSAMAVVALIARRGWIVPWPTLIWLAAFFVIGAFAQRGVAWWPLALVPAVAGTLIPSRPDPEPAASTTMRRLNGLIAGLLVVIGIALLPIWRPIDSGTMTPSGVLTDAPSGITAALRDLARPGDRIFNAQPWGSWFEYALPDARYAIDSRIDFFPSTVWQDYETVEAGADGWSRILGTTNVSLVVLKAPSDAMIERLTAAGWDLRYEDGEGAIFAAPGRTIGALTLSSRSVDSET